MCASGTELLRCGFADGAFFVEHETCPPGTVCTTLDDTGEPGCAPSPPCADVGAQGRCTGAILSRCEAGAVQNTDCSASGQVCSWGGSASGYDCLPAGASGAFGVAGTVRYEDRMVGLSGLGPPAPRAARGVTLAVVTDATGDVLAAALTADDGSYSVQFDAPAGTMVHLLAATTSPLPARPLRVVRPDGLVHGFGGPGFTPALGGVQDLLITDLSGEAEAFNVFDELVTGMDAVRTWLGLTDLVPLEAIWARGADIGTHFRFGGQPTIFVGGSLADDDGYDDAVVVHELGHYVEAWYTRADSSGGAHAGGPIDPRLAWSEGFANWFGSVTRADPVYVDTFYGGVAFSFNLDTDRSRADPAGPAEQGIPEGVVGEILWDVSDAPASDDDPMTSASPQAVLGIMRSYFRGPDFLDRGMAGVDLVDWLDGWFFLRGGSDCGPLRTIVVTEHGFPYDFARPDAVCP